MQSSNHNVNHIANQKLNHNYELKAGSTDDFITPSWSLLDLAKHLEVEIIT